jgi:hypothetical protein
MPTSFKVSFTISGHGFDPNVITTTLQITPTKVWREGDVIPNTKSTWKHDGWRLTTEETEGFDTTRHLREILDKLSPVEPLVRSLCNTHNLSAELSCAVYIEDQAPILHFDRDIVEQLANLSAEIDIDVLPTGSSL